MPRNLHEEFLGCDDRDGGYIYRISISFRLAEASGKVHLTKPSSVPNPHTHKYIVYRAVLTFKITKLCNGDDIYFVIKCSRHLQLYYSTYIIYLGHRDGYYLLALYTMIWYLVYYNINK